MRPDWRRIHGMKGTPEYKAWCNMIERCYCVTHSDYKNYGGRGVKVCLSWRTGFINFFNDMGNRPEGRSLDRIDNDGDYEPGNVRWATRKEQARNRRTAKLAHGEVEIIRRLLGQGVKQATLAYEFGVSQSTISRIVSGEIWG